MAFSYEEQLQIFLISSRGEPTVLKTRIEPKANYSSPLGLNMLENVLQNLGIGQFFGKT